MTISSTPPLPLLPPSLTAARTPEGVDPKDTARVREVARDLEALLVSQMIAAMRRTVPESGMLQASASRRVLDDAFDHELARALAADGSLGFAQQIEAQLLARGAAVSTTKPAAQAPTASVPAAEAPAASELVATTDATVVVRGERAVAEARRIGATERTVEEPGGVSESGRRIEASAVTRLPLEAPRVTSDFGRRIDPITGADRFHAGVDLGAPTGTPIHAAADGEVVFSGRRGAAGNVVEVRHADGLVTSYAHAEQTLVAPGQRVVAGEVIATVGSTGRSTGPHLHFSVQRDGQVIDPKHVFPELGAGGRHG